MIMTIMIPLSTFQSTLSTETMYNFHETGWLFSFWGLWRVDLMEFFEEDETGQRGLQWQAVTTSVLFTQLVPFLFLLLAPICFLPFLLAYVVPVLRCGNTIVVPAGRFCLPLSSRVHGDYQDLQTSTGLFFWDQWDSSRPKILMFFLSYTHFISNAMFCCLQSKCTFRFYPLVLKISVLYVSELSRHD